MNLFDIVHEVEQLRSVAPSPHFAVFDFDGSVIENDSGEAVLAYMARHEYPSAKENFQIYHSLLDVGEIRTAYRFGAGTLKGLSIEEVRDVVRRTMDEEGRAITKTQLFGRTIAHGIALREHVVELMRMLEGAGVKVWIVSASPELVVRATLEYFELNPRMIGVRNILQDGAITGALREPLPIFEGKVDCIKQCIHPCALSKPPVQPLLGVGDGMDDLPMLEYSRLHAVVDPDNSLREKARAEKWFILEARILQGANSESAVASE